MAAPRLSKPERVALEALRLGELRDEDRIEHLVKRGLAYWIGGVAFISEKGRETLLRDMRLAKGFSRGALRLARKGK